jgi:hypothetical protein
MLFVKKVSIKKTCGWVAVGWPVRPSDLPSHPEKGDKKLTFSTLIFLKLGCIYDLIVSSDHFHKSVNQFEKNLDLIKQNNYREIQNTFFKSSITFLLTGML